MSGKKKNTVRVRRDRPTISGEDHDEPKEETPKKKPKVEIPEEDVPVETPTTENSVEVTKEPEDKAIEEPKVTPTRVTRSRSRSPPPVLPKPKSSVKKPKGLDGIPEAKSKPSPITVDEDASVTATDLGISSPTGAETNLITPQARVLAAISTLQTQTMEFINSAMADSITFGTNASKERETVRSTVDMIQGMIKCLGAFYSAIYLMRAGDTKSASSDLLLIRTNLRKLPSLSQIMEGPVSNLENSIASYSQTVAKSTDSDTSDADWGIHADSEGQGVGVPKSVKWAANVVEKRASTFPMNGAHKPVQQQQQHQQLQQLQQRQQLQQLHQPQQQQRPNSNISASILQSKVPVGMQRSIAMLANQQRAAAKTSKPQGFSFPAMSRPVRQAVSDDMWDDAPQAPASRPVSSGYPPAAARYPTSTVYQPPPPRKAPQFVTPLNDDSNLDLSQEEEFKGAPISADAAQKVLGKFYAQIGQADPGLSMSGSRSYLSGTADANTGVSYDDPM